MGHLKGGQALSQKLSCLRYELNVLFARHRPPQERRQYPMVDGHHIQDGKLLGESATADLVGLLERCFAPARNVVLQGSGVLHVQLIEDGFRRHRSQNARPPPARRRFPAYTAPGSGRQCSGEDRPSPHSRQIRYERRP